MSILAGFAPWIVYWVLIGNVPFDVAVLAAPLIRVFHDLTRSGGATRIDTRLARQAVLNKGPLFIAGVVPMYIALSVALLIGRHIQQLARCSGIAGVHTRIAGLTIFDERSLYIT